MHFIQGSNRSQTQLFPVSLEEAISEDNEVRIIDFFVASIDVKEFGFVIKQSTEGRPAYHPSDLLKLFIYGYLNRIRSSRSLEKECKRNIELMWLLKSLSPDHNTISNFRKENSLAIKEVFRSTVKLAKAFNLIGGKLLAGDSTKLRAQNSKKNNYNPKKIERHLVYIEEKLEAYSQVLAEADEDTKEVISKEIKKQQHRKAGYQALEKQLAKAKEKQISTSDPDSRHLVTRNNITEVAYNVQTTVDAEHCIPIDYKVTNRNDSRAMGEMLHRAKDILGTTGFTALYDKGYHTGNELKTGKELGIKLMVAIPAVASVAPDPAFNMMYFVYNEQQDTYTCPQKHEMKTNGNWYVKHHETYPTRTKHYKTNKCQDCPVRAHCTKNLKGRLIERSEHAPFVEWNKQNITSEPQVYKKRQAIVEHPYGTIKRQWGFSYILTKRGIERAAADVGLIFVAYNLKRIMAIVGTKKLQEYLKDIACKKITLNAVFNVMKKALSYYKGFETPGSSFQLAA
jgi:transposase